MMYFSRIKLTNWKNFHAVEASLGQRVFLIGPNASGKSNFLDAFRFLRDVADTGLQRATGESPRGGVSNLRCLAAREHSQIGIEVDVTAIDNVVWTYRLVFNQNKDREVVIRDETVLRDGDLVRRRPGSEDEKDERLLTQTHLEQLAANHDFRDLADYFKTVTYQNLLPQVVRDPRGFSPLPVSNDPYGRDFLVRLWTTKKRARDSRLKKITAALKQAVPQLVEMDVQLDESGTPHLVGRYAHWRFRLARQNESQFSDGTLRLIGLFWTMFEGGGPILLEEPEISLHEAIVRQLPAIFYRLNSGRKARRQIIISTHSEALLGDPGIAAEEVWCLEPGAEGTKLIQATERDRAAIKAGATVADILLPRTRPEGIEQLVLELG